MKLLHLCIIVSLSIFFCGTGVFALDFTADPKAFNDTLTQELLHKHNTYKGNRRQVVQNFCSTALSHGLLANNEGQTLLYDPRQSVFLYFLCTHIDRGLYQDNFVLNKQRLDKTYMKMDSFRDFQLICQSREDGQNYPKGCVPGCKSYDGNDMGSCDFSLLLPPVMVSVLNDYSNVGLSLAYGVYMSEESKKIDDMVNEMAMKYYGGVLYNDKFTEYPKTLNHGKKFIRNARKFAVRADVIDVKNMRKIGNKKDKTDCNQVSLTLDGADGLPTYDLFACPYSLNNFFSQNESSLRGYINLMYNEVFWYQLFVNYYSYILRTDTSLLPFQLTDAPVEQWKTLTQEAVRLQDDVQIILHGIGGAHRTITNVNGAFWIHLGLYMYYEELQKFRDALAKVYTPIHQLYYKMRNVQAKE